MQVTANLLNQLMVFMAATGLMAAGWGYIVLPDTSDWSPDVHSVALPFGSH